MPGGRLPPRVFLPRSCSSFHTWRGAGHARRRRHDGVVQRPRASIAPRELRLSRSGRHAPPPHSDFPGNSGVCLSSPLRFDSQSMLSTSRKKSKHPQHHHEPKRDFTSGLQRQVATDPGGRIQHNSSFDRKMPSPRPRRHLPPGVFLPRSCSSFPTGRGRRGTLRKRRGRTTGTGTRWRCPEAPCHHQAQVGLVNPFG